MKFNIFAFLTSVTLLALSLCLGRNAVMNLNLDAEKLNHFHKLYFTSWNPLYDIQLKLLDESDKLLYREYSNILFQYGYLSVAGSFLCVIMLAIVLKDAFNLLKQSKRIKQEICKHRGHKWEIYSVSTGYYSYDVEQAGYCTRCGEDTHGQYPG